jgi:hypothetical protein
MVQENSGLRERLLARLPQPENVAAYREEVAILLAKHERALSTVRWAPILLFLCAFGITELLILRRAQLIGTDAGVILEILACALLFVAGVNALSYRIYRSKVDLLKEIKQVQLQVLELQASLQKSGNASGL